ncbi:response regulator [Radiobacillus kanasensis]|uniref:response regulator n=1 Tax=Radiobacillus kanasensis TaxID=2844358 RepID=UPI001E48C2C6|nr:response regulator [Radiobacillus kanasensis]UFT98973.1 response regulator [Radiobacillus kanasensis]
MKKTVMIVDDQMGIRMLLEEVVKAEGHEVMTAENGKDALDKIKQKRPDLMLIDYKLPIMDGPTLLTHLEEQGENIPAIMMSGLVEEATLHTERFEQVKEVFAKPFDVDEAREHINRLLREES